VDEDENEKNISEMSEKEHSSSADLDRDNDGELSFLSQSFKLPSNEKDNSNSKDDAIKTTAALPFKANYPSG
jgi:hypothetical protein